MKTEIFMGILDETIKSMGYEPDELHLTKMKLTDKIVVNDNGKLQEVMFMDVFMQPKTRVEYIEFDINLTENGIKEI